MRVAMIGTRGVPAAYGGFETAIEEIGSRLAARGIDVTVYCRNADVPDPAYRGMRLVHLPAMKGKSVETLSHTALSALHCVARRRTDAAFVFNAANSPFVPLLRLRGIPVAVHVDGIEWMRAKWGGAGRRYYRFAESFAVRNADALIADAPGISDYYAHQFGVATELIAYGAPIIDDSGDDLLADAGLTPGGYFLVVARFEPENHVAEIVEGYSASSASRPLVVVGSAPYSEAYTARITAAAANDPRIRLLGGVWDQRLLDQLYAHALTYIHGHSVGGTNPSLLRAIGAGTAVIAYDVSFNRHILREDGSYFTTATELRQAITEAEKEPAALLTAGSRLREFARRVYDWDDVAAAYESLAVALTQGRSLRKSRGHRRSSEAWTVASGTGAS